MSSDYSDSDDTLTSFDDLKDDLLDHISAVRSSGSFATFGNIENFEHPGISVNSIGIIGLPLSENDAHALTQASRHAPFGKGTGRLLNEIAI